ncbi:MAG TPA: hypothetical protein VFZ66_19105 [Herpetosiphonaceae bacterium]
MTLMTLLHPRAHTRSLLALFALGLALAGLAMSQIGMPLWGGTTIVLALLVYPATLKWRDDIARWGLPIAILGILLALQGFHTVEHVTQWVQFHLLHWPPKRASGLLSAANAELVHFVWNWSVALTVGYLLRAGLRNGWGYLLLAWALAHSLEHTYLFVQYVDAVRTLWSQDAALAFAQGLPGIVGRHGWLDTSGWQYAPTAFLCRLTPQLITSTRLDVHFWWNVGETGLLLPFAHVAVRRRFRSS